MAWGTQMVTALPFHPRGFCIGRSDILGTGVNPHWYRRTVLFSPHNSRLRQMLLLPYRLWGCNQMTEEAVLEGTSYPYTITRLVLCYSMHVFPFSLWLCYPRYLSNPYSNPSSMELPLITLQLSLFSEFPKHFACPRTLKLECVLFIFLLSCASSIVPSRMRPVFHTFLHLPWQWLSK